MSPDQMSPGLRARLKVALQNVALLAFSCLLLASVAELTLRLTGFSFVLKPEDIQFGGSDATTLRLVFDEDDELFWVPKDYRSELELLRRERPPLLLLGDSCTHLGRYDQALARRVAARGQTLRYGNLGVAGWSSFQGRQQLERDVPALEPLVVTLYFGWNDHWIGFGIDDRNVLRVRRLFRSRLAGIRLVQLLTKARVAWIARETNTPRRVSLADFRANLEAMVEQVRELGAEPLLLTAPSNHVPGRELEAFEQGYLVDRKELIPLHRAYVEVVRAVASAQRAPLCDLESHFAAKSQAERDQLFMKDGLHLLPAGDEVLAAELDLCLERAGLWSRLQD